MIRAVSTSCRNCFFIELWGGIYLYLWQFVHACGYW